MNKTSPLVIALLISGTEAINHGFRPTAGSVPWGPADATRPTWDTPTHPVNYFVPNFGMDHNVLTTMNSLQIAESGSGKALKASFAQDKHEDMRVPDLGQDEDVKNSLAAIGEAQKESGKTIGGVNFGQKQVQYAQSLGQDVEVSDSIGSINMAEKKFNSNLPYEKIAQPVSYNQGW